MNENQLETFFAVSKYESFSKAANALNVTQPTITSRIKSLEAILDYKLFTRVGHAISLTAEGILFTEYAKNILTYMNQAKNLKHIVQAPVIRVGFSPGYSYSFVIEVLKAVKSVGEIDVEIINRYDSTILNERLLLGEVDLIFTRDLLTNNMNVISEYLFDNQLVVVLPTNHSLENKDSLTICDLRNETILSYRRNSTLWNAVDQLLVRAENITRIDVENNEMLLNAVANDLGVGIIPKLGIDHKYKPNITIKNVTELAQIPNSVYVHYRKKSQIEKLAKKIIYSVINHKYSVN